MSGEVRLVAEGCYAFGRWGELQRRQAMAGATIAYRADGWARACGSIDEPG